MSKYASAKFERSFAVNTATDKKNQSSEWHNTRAHSSLGSIKYGSAEAFSQSYTGQSRMKNDNVEYLSEPEVEKSITSENSVRNRKDPLSKQEIQEEDEEEEEVQDVDHEEDDVTIDSLPPPCDYNLIWQDLRKKYFQPSDSLSPEKALQIIDDVIRIEEEFRETASKMAQIIHKESNLAQKKKHYPR